MPTTNTNFVKQTDETAQERGHGTQEMPGERAGSEHGKMM